MWSLLPHVDEAVACSVDTVYIGDIGQNLFLLSPTQIETVQEKSRDTLRKVTWFPWF